MRAVALVLCLAAGASAAAAEPDAREYRIREVRFAGDLAFAPEVLADVLEALDARRVIPGIWTLRPKYDAHAVDADLTRLRFFYLVHGYFDAQVGIADVTFDGGDATVTLNVQAGPRSRVRHVKIEGLFGEREKRLAEPSGAFPVEPLCACLLDARRAAETDGRLDFDTVVEVAPVDGDGHVVDVTARVRMGSAHTVGRIQFSGHYRINESTLRRAMALKEGEVFDVGKLRHSLARLNASGLFEPLALTDVGIATGADGVSAGLTIPLRERRGRAWSLSGPLVPPGLASLRASISSRLPAWGRGLFEASTYYLTLNLIGLAHPILSALPIASKARPALVLALERPYLPGQALFSGFAVSPSLSPREMLTHYASAQATRGVRAALGGDQRDAMAMPVTTAGSRAAGAEIEQPVPRLLICDPPRPRLSWLRHGAIQAADLALAWLP